MTLNKDETDDDKNATSAAANNDDKDDEGELLQIYPDVAETEEEQEQIKSIQETKRPAEPRADVDAKPATRTHSTKKPKEPLKVLASGDAAAILPAASKKNEETGDGMILRQSKAPKVKTAASTVVEHDHGEPKNESPTTTTDDDHHTHTHEEAATAALTTIDLDRQAEFQSQPGALSIPGPGRFHRDEEEDDAEEEDGLNPGIDEENQGGVRNDNDIVMEAESSHLIVATLVEEGDNNSNSNNNNVEAPRPAPKQKLYARIGTATGFLLLFLTVAVVLLFFFVLGDDGNDKGNGNSSNNNQQPTEPSTLSSIPSATSIPSIQPSMTPSATPSTSPTQTAAPTTTFPTLSPTISAPPLMSYDKMALFVVEYGFYARNCQEINAMPERIQLSCPDADYMEALQYSFHAQSGTITASQYGTNTEEIQESASMPNGVALDCGRPHNNVTTSSVTADNQLDCSIRKRGTDNLFGYNTFLPGDWQLLMVVACARDDRAYDMEGYNDKEIHNNNRTTMDLQVTVPPGVKGSNCTVPSSDYAAQITDAVSVGSVCVDIVVDEKMYNETQIGKDLYYWGIEDVSVGQDWVQPVSITTETTRQEDQYVNVSLHENDELNKICSGGSGQPIFIPVQLYPLEKYVLPYLACSQKDQCASPGDMCDLEITRTSYGSRTSTCFIRPPRRSEVSLTPDSVFPSDYAYSELYRVFVQGINGPRIPGNIFSQFAQEQQGGLVSKHTAAPTSFPTRAPIPTRAPVPSPAPVPFAPVWPGAPWVR